MLTYDLLKIISGIFFLKFEIESKKSTLDQELLKQINLMTWFCSAGN